MASAIKWGAISGATSVTITLNSVANGGVAVASVAIDNTVSLNRWGWVEIILGSFTATAAGMLNIYIVNSLDGTNFDEGVSTTNPAGHELVQSISLNINGAIAHRVMSTVPFPLPPTKFKLAVMNRSGAAFASSGCSMNFYTSNESVG